MDKATERSPAPVSRRPAGSWRARRQESRPAARRARRLLATLGVVALLAVFAYLLIAPLGRPKAALILARPIAANADGLPASSPYGARDVAAVIKATEGFLVAPAIDLSSERPPAETFGPVLHGSSPEADVLVVFVHADAVAEDGRAVLLWGTESGETERRRFPIRDLLAGLAEHPAGTKVLLLDAGDAAADRRAGRLAGDVSPLLTEACRNGHDGVWVLASHSDGESSHVSPALGRSVFGYWVARGLSGAADLDRDGFVHLRELHRYVAAGVSEWVHQTTGGRESQTPRLLVCGSSRTDAADPLLVPARRWFRSDREDAALQTALADARKERASLEDGQATASATESAAGSTDAMPKLPELPKGAPKPALPAAIGSQAVAGAAATAAAAADTETGTTSTGPASTGTTSTGPASTSPASTGTANLAAIASQRPMTARELIDAGWMLRDDLEHGVAVRPDPRRDAPHLWRAYVRRLLELETAIETGSEAERTAAMDELRRLVLPLRRWAAGGGPEPEAAEPVRSLTSARPPGPSWQAPTLGMEEARAAGDASALSPALAAVITEFDRHVAGGKPEEFAKWLAALAPEHARYAELVLARRLTTTPGLDWNIVQETLATRRLAERTAANVEAALWLAPAIDEADVLRRTAERLLLDGLGANRQAMAQSLLKRARAHYDDAAATIDELRDAALLRDRLLDRAPEWIAWLRSSKSLPGPHSPDQADVLAMLGATEELASLLDAPSPGTTDRVLAASRRAQSLLANLEAGLDEGYLRGELAASPDTADDFLRMQALLATSLPAAKERNALRDAARRADATLVTQLPWAALRREPARSAVAVPDDEPADRMDVEYQLARLALGASVADRLKPLTAARQASPGRADAAARRFEAAVGEFWRRSLPAIANAVPPATTGQDSRLGDLHAAVRALRLLDPRDALSMKSDPIAALQAERLALLLQWQAGRFERTRNDAPGDERRVWELLATASRSAAAEITGRESEAPSLGIAVEGPDRISLESRASATVEMTVENLEDEAVDVWLVVDHDPALLAIEKPSAVLTPALRLRRQRDDSPPSAIDPARLNRPDADGARPAFQLPPRGRQTISLPLQRVSGSGQPTRVILRAIARIADARDSDDDVAMARSDVVVSLPSVAPAELIVEGPPGCVGGTAERPVVSPYPNRVTSFRLFLANRTGGTATVDVGVFAAKPVTNADDERRTTDELPTEIGIDATTAASLLARWTDGTPLFSVAELALPADGTPVPLPFPKPVPSQAPDPAVEQGLLVVVTDRATGRLSVQPLLFRPQHPRRYLEPVVRYDAQAERIEIRVLPRSDALLPPGGSRVTGEILGRLPVEATRRLEGLVVSTERPAELFVETAGVRAEAIDLQLTVDGYPRAFHYRVPLSGTRSNIPPETGTSAVRIRAPSPGVSFKTPIASVPVSVEVDAPIGARWSAGDAVEIGFDRDRDRELRGEESIRLHSDRQIAVGVRALSPGGEIAVATTVSDFQIDLPADHLERGRVNLIGRLVTGSREVWSAPVELTFDDVPPPIRRVFLSRQQVVAGEPLRVVAEASDSGLSGVAQVLVGVDLERTGAFGAEPKPVAAVNEQGRWVATLDTAALLPGPYFVLVRAVDAVGIAGPYSRERFEVVTPEQMAAAKAAAVNRIGGFVNYRGRPMAGFEVLVEPLPDEPPPAAGAPSAAPPPPAPAAASATKLPPASTNDRGAFEVSQVPPGRYRVTASGLYANGRREGFVDVTVPPYPAEVPPVEIEVDPR